MTPPDLLSFTGDWTTYSESVYQRYHNDLVANTAKIWGRGVQLRWNPTAQGKPFNFWHVISEGDQEDERTPDLERCARISWIAWTIACCDKGEDCIRWWLSERSTSRGKKTNLVLWAHEHDYVVILEPREDHAMLVSAYPLRGRRAQKLAKEYAAFVAAPRPIPYWG